MRCAVDQIKTNLILSGGKTLSGVLPAISSKSELHRLVFCACLADKSVSIRYSSELSKDIEATISCFKALGAEITVSEKEIAVKKPISYDFIEKNITVNTEVFCGESGSTARFLLPLLSVFCKNGVTMTGTGKLPQRPFSDLCRCLSAHGAVFSSENLPITIQKSCEPQGVLEISGNISSQYLSGLLFILPFFDRLKIKLTTALESSGYVDMTIEAMKKFGVSITCDKGIYTACGSYRTPYARDAITAGGDWSNAAFFLCAAKQSDKITITGIDSKSLQPDRKICEILSECGFEIKTGENCISVRRGAKLVPFDTDAGETPDLVPILCVLAATISGDSVVRNISRLRFKESDRIKAVCNMISALGGTIYADDSEDAIFIHGSGSLSGGTVKSFNDHRIVMSAAAASCFCSNDVTIEDADAVSKSYPRFFRDFNTLTENLR